MCNNNTRNTKIKPGSNKSVMKILILLFVPQIKESRITRGYHFMLVKKQSRLDVRKYSFSRALSMYEINYIIN